MSSETSVVRIIHLDDLTTEYSLKEFLLSSTLVLGAINNVFIGIENELQIVFAYVTFEYGDDARRVVNRLNGFYFQNKVLEVELIGPNLPYKRYKQTRKSSATVSTNTRFKTTNITSPTKSLHSQSNELDIDSSNCLDVRVNRGFSHIKILPGEYRNILTPASKIINTTQPAGNTARFSNKNNNEPSAAIRNSVKAGNSTPQAGTYTSTVFRSWSSNPHLSQKTNSFNRMPSKATHNKIQPSSRTGVYNRRPARHMFASRESIYTSTEFLDDYY